MVFTYKQEYAQLEDCTQVVKNQFKELVLC